MDLWSQGAPAHSRAVAESRSGEQEHAFLGDWRGSMICDDHGGYKISFSNGITVVGCMAHARRKFFEQHANGASQIVGQALQYIGLIYDSSRGQGPERPRQTGHRAEQSRRMPTLCTN